LDRQAGETGRNAATPGTRAGPRGSGPQQAAYPSQQREKKPMNPFRVFAGALALLAPLSFACVGATAQEKFKIAIGQINNWENQAPTLGQDVGIFRKHGIVLEAFGTQGAGETIQPVLSGSADFGAGVGVAGVMRAFARGGPVRILAPMFTGTGDIYWYVRADSPIKSLQDATDKHTIAYSTSGSTSNNIVLAFVNDLGVKAKPTATGGPPGTFTQVMSGQIDIGWSAPPFGLREAKEGKIRIIGRGSDAKSLHGQTIRVLIVNAETLKNRKDAVTRFLQAYRETVDWMYSNPDAIKRYAAKTNLPEELIKDSVAQYHPKPAMQTEEVKDLDGIMRDAVKLKFLDQPLTKEQIAEFIQIPPRR
jgi:NitT/TauT family transport system substrate-binding protein